MYEIESGISIEFFPINLVNFQVEEKKFVEEAEFYSSISNPRYKSHYEKLINRAKTRVIEGYVEKHHIVPKCLGGSNDKSNLVKISAEEHYVAHQLLVKMFPENKKLIYAANMMCVGKDSDCKRPHNKQYKWLKLKVSELHKSYRASDETKAKIGAKSKGRIFSKEAKLKISEAGKGRKVKPEHRAKLVSSRKGKPSKVWNEEDRLKHSQRLKGIPKSELTKERMTKAQTGKKHSEETKLKISETLKRKNKQVTL